MVSNLQVSIALVLFVMDRRTFQVLRTDKIKAFDTDGPVLLMAKQDNVFAISHIGRRRRAIIPDGKAKPFMRALERPSLRRHLRSPAGLYFESG